MEDEFIRTKDDLSENSNDFSALDEAFLGYGSDYDEDLPKEFEESNPTKPSENDAAADDEYLNSMNTTRKNDEDELAEQEDDSGLDKRCAYCGISNPLLLARCNEKDCQKWFCNGRADEMSPSHIVFHFTKSRHKELHVGKDSLIGELNLECYHCSGKNIFLLGYLEAKEDDAVFILCREPCLTSCKLDETKFEKSNWNPLIKDKSLVDWIVPHPSNNELKLCLRITIRNMTKLEEKWEKEKLKINSEKPKFLGNFLKPVKLCYNDGQDYKDIFEPLIQAEEEYDKKLKESQKKYSIKVSFYKKSRKTVAKFTYPREDTEMKLVSGDEMKIVDPRTNKPYKGFVIKIELDDEVHLEFDKNINFADGMYSVEFVWKGTSFKRMLDGLYSFVNDESSVSSHIYYKLLGHNIEDKKTDYGIIKNLEMKGLPELNYYQSLGIKKALQSPLFLIQGPPGTGKTVTSAAIVYQMAQLKMGKVLVAAPSNIAADQLAERIHKTGLNVVRVSAKSRESINSRVEFLTLHNQIKNWKGKDSKRLLDLILRKEENEELSDEDHKVYKKLKKKAENDILNQAEVICTTCIASFDKRLTGLRFPLVLIDEATQACESECILPLLRGAKHAVLVGDHCQLGPVVLCKNAAKAGLKLSLFERLVRLKIKPHMLEVQYRMHPKLSEFPSNTFYNGNLQNGVSAEERIHHSVNFNWPNSHKPMFFYHIQGQEEFSASGTSYLNRKEADVIERVVTSFLKSSVKPEQIGIITPYEGQRSYVVMNMIKNGIVSSSLYKEIEVASVDSFQGREKDYIILSCVRSNDNNGIGFLNDPKRLNVALTRARYGLVIVGNALALSKHTLWNNLLHHYKSNGLLVEGNLNSFKEVVINLKPPQKFIPERNCWENQLNTTIESISVDLSYSDINEEKSDKYSEALNQANVSRFSDFGFTNDKESVDHYKKVQDIMRNRAFKLPPSVRMNKFDSLMSQLNFKTPQQFNPMMNNFVPSAYQAKNLENNLNENQKLINSLITRYMFNERKFVMNTEF